MDPTYYNAILSVAGGMFAVSFLIMTWRIATGPTPLDRIIGMDGFTAMLQCAFATYICWSLDTTVTNAMLVVALLGFISTIAVARFYRKGDDA